MSGATGFAMIGLALTRALPYAFTPVMATTVLEYFILGLVLMWLYILGDWLQPTNLIVIFTFIFRLYRRNKTLDDLSAEEIGRLFPDGVSERGLRGSLQRTLLRVRRSPVVGSLLLGSFFAVLMVAMLVISSHLP